VPDEPRPRPVRVVSHCAWCARDRAALARGRGWQRCDRAALGPERSRGPVSAATNGSPILGLAHVGVAVRSIAQSMDAWRRGLGFELVDQETLESMRLN